MAILSNQIPDSLDPIFKDVFYNEDRAYPMVMPKLFKESEMQWKIEKDSSMTGVGLTPRKTESADTTLDEIYEEYNKTWTQLAYGLGVTVSREALDFDLHGSTGDLPRAMRRSLDATVETLAANHLNRHISSSYTGGDGLALCHNSHTTNASSATFDNLGTAGSLTHTTLADLRLLQRKMKNPRELPEMINSKYFVVPLDLEEKARIILGDHYKSGSANYDVNIFNNAGLEIVVWPYITVTTAYWLIAQDNPLKWKWGVRPEFNRDKGVSEQVAKWFTYFRAVSGFNGFRGIVGNNGA